jgi:hypothetical protein
VYTGDNFILEYVGSAFVTSAFNGEPNCEGSPSALCEFDLSWSEVGGQLESISLNALSVNYQIGPGFGLTGGRFGSDFFVDNCVDAQCFATGFWQSDLPVPEPMSASFLLSGLLGLALTRRFLRP